MPQFTIEDAQTGRRITVEGETEPTPSEMEELFATYQQPAEPQPSDEAMRMSRVLRGKRPLETRWSWTLQIFSVEALGLGLDLRKRLEPFDLPAFMTP